MKIFEYDMVEKIDGLLDKYLFFSTEKGREGRPFEREKKNDAMKSKIAIVFFFSTFFFFA